LGGFPLTGEALPGKDKGFDGPVFPDFSIPLIEV
jgi:hypothetical protein